MQVKSQIVLAVVAAQLLSLAIAAPTVFTCPNPATNPSNLYPNPDDRSKFYQCDASCVAYSMSCPPGLVFNSVSSTCARVIGCPPASQMGPGNLYPNPDDCTKFFQCNSNIVSCFNCPAGLHFNPTLFVCDWPANSGCVQSSNVGGAAISGAFDFMSAADNEQWVYADGVLIGHLTNWGQTLTSHVPAGTKVLAVRITDYDLVVGGLIGSSADGSFVTNSSWKCTRDTPAAGWTKATYDDSQWPQAVAGLKQGEGVWGARPNIAASAYWIWNGPYATSYSGLNVYCRRLLRAPSPCDQ